ncbi:serine hydrolase domain-containing protein [Xanthomonas sp. XNM01]|uniref:serine hydrolase domain-containing protein n=1 Tax=Xanthomonas sp. XNM01 TaxID=2769289 RepID=UPI00177F9CB8|nr:serine hydrolase domain-containing protein [Xanthomonas sp. XNM01]MBD9368556.1 serine hydrolase [Xanthomonas sp. XNM01]
MKTRFAASLVLAAVAGTAGAAPLTDATLEALVQQRLQGDRTGACMAVAVIEQGRVARSYSCADAAARERIGPDRAFEIGSVSKTMTAALLAEMIDQGKGALDDPLADWLPPGTTLPAFDGQPILLRHVVTHTSGLPALPSRLGATSMDDPYANLDAEALLASLGDVTLTRAPGSRFEYSNFASMVLSYAVARRAGSDLEALLRKQLFAPLDMQHAYVNQAPAGVRAAQGHAPNRQPVPAWRFATDLAGVGGVRATLDDMVGYVRGQLGGAPEPLAAAIALSQQPVSQQPAMAMNWMLVPVAGRTVLMHEGGTGGFSSFVSVDPQRQRGVVILSDTTWNSIGGLGSLGLHLVDASLPLGKPRHPVSAPTDLLQALAGDYQLQGAMAMTLRVRDGALFAQADGQPEFALAYDDAGDFHPLQLDAILRPQRKADGSYVFAWHQMGAVMPATRLDAARPAAPAPDAAALQAYAGEYPLMPGFVLSVREQGGVLQAQATGQGAFPLTASGADTFEAPAFGIELRFARDAAGNVQSLELHQGGQVLRGARQR